MNLSKFELPKKEEGFDNIVYPWSKTADVAQAEARLSAARSIRTGMGYDVHRLVDTRRDTAPNYFSRELTVELVGGAGFFCISIFRVLALSGP